MENFVVLTGKKIDNEWLRVYVQDRKGFWDAPRGSYGIFEQGDDRLEVYLFDFEDEYDPEELVVIKRLLGEPPASAIAVAYSHRDSSEALARQFSAELTKVLDGFFDDNTTDVRTLEALAPQGNLGQQSIRREEE